MGPFIDYDMIPKDPEAAAAEQAEIDRLEQELARLKRRRLHY